MVLRVSTIEPALKAGTTLKALPFTQLLVRLSPLAETLVAQEAPTPMVP